MKTLHLRLSIIIFLMTFVLTKDLKSQFFSVDTLYYNGSPDKFINIVFIGDGYQMSELDTFVTNALNSTHYFFNTSPFKEYQNYFNVFAIRVPSIESGATHPRTAFDCPPEIEHPMLMANTYFSSTFDHASMHRLLVSSDHAAVNSVLINNFPLYDLPIMLVNSPHYGGSGGAIAIASTFPGFLSHEIVLHEIGHSFADLADEYWVGYGTERPNMTQESDSSLIKWSNWLGHDGIGIYPHGTTGYPSTWFRPHDSCKMRFLGYPFCSVCVETIALTTLKVFGSPILSHYPVDTLVNFSNDSIVFSLDIVKPVPNTIRTQWTLNGSMIAQNIDSLTIFNLHLTADTNLLFVEVLDTTPLIRADTHAISNTHKLEWTIYKQTTEIETGFKDIPKIAFYPNPFNDLLTIESHHPHQPTKYKILNALGQLIEENIFFDKVNISTQHFRPGIYFVKIFNDQSLIVRKIVKA